MATTFCCACGAPSASRKQFLPGRRHRGGPRRFWRPPPRLVATRASMVESSSDFVRRIERAWLISQQPRPVACSSCQSNGYVDCKWCRGTGFFILGNNVLCEVPSRNTSCIICAGKGHTSCSDCQGTGFRAKWLGDPATSPPSQ